MGESGGIQAGKATNRCGGAKPACGGGAEKGQRRGRGNAEIPRHIRAHSHRRQQIAAGDPALPLGLRHGGGQQGRERMQDSWLANAVKLLAMHLIAVDQSGNAGRQTVTAPPEPGFAAHPPAAGRLAQLPGTRCAGTGNTDAERVENEHFRPLNRGLWQIFVAGRDDVPGEGLRERRGHQINAPQAGRRNPASGR